jgi:hypothetical protein
MAATRGAIPPHFQHLLFIHDPAMETTTPYQFVTLPMGGLGRLGFDTRQGVEGPSTFQPHKCNAANRMGTDMTYRDDFYVVGNMYGYTGQVNDNPTVYFVSATEHGRITQDHPRTENIGRDVVKSIEGYSIGNEPDANGVLRCLEYDEYVGYDRATFDKSHRSRGALVLISETAAADRAVLAQSIWRHTELKKNRRRKSV